MQIPMLFSELPEATLEPPLRWVGGKRWLVHRLHWLWCGHSHRRLVEPFVGGMAIALSLRPRRALLNDVNAQLINFYRWLQRGLVIDRPMELDRSLFAAYRERFNTLISSGQTDSQEAAEIFYYLNRTGVNGIYRVNKAGLYNVPCGDTASYQRDFTPYRQQLARWQFTCGDFAALSLEPGDFVYADPPYDGVFSDYAAPSFVWADQVRLATWLAEHPGPVVTSNNATERVLDLYRGLGFSVKLVDAPRRVSANGDRTPASEILAMKGL